MGLGLGPGLGPGLGLGPMQSDCSAVDPAGSPSSRLMFDFVVRQAADKKYISRVAWNEDISKGTVCLIQRSAATVQTTARRTPKAICTESRVSICYSVQIDGFHPGVGAEHAASGEGAGEEGRSAQRTLRGAQGTLRGRSEYAQRTLRGHSRGRAENAQRRSENAQTQLPGRSETVQRTLRGAQRRPEAR